MATSPKDYRRGLAMARETGDLNLPRTINTSDVRAYVRNVMQGGGVVAPIHQIATPYDIVPGRQRPLHSVSMLNPAWNTTADQALYAYSTGRTIMFAYRWTVRGLGAYAWCDIPPYSALIRTSAELADLLGTHRANFGFFPPDRGKWSLHVYVLAEPSEPRRGLHCENGSIAVGAGLSPEESPPGNVDDIGVMALVLDTYGNLANLSGPPASIIGLGRAPRVSEGDFDISLEFGDGFSEEWQAAIRHSADRWEQIIVADYPDSHADLDDVSRSSRPTRACPNMAATSSSSRSVPKPSSALSGVPQPGHAGALGGRVDWHGSDGSYGTVPGRKSGHMAPRSGHSCP